MNCFNHPSLTAVAQCLDCGKGLCVECASAYKETICTNCVKARRRKSITAYTLLLSFYALLFILGYRWDFMAVLHGSDAQIWSGYILMSIFTGYQFVNAIAPFKMTSGDAASWNFYYIFKFILYLIVGFFTAPLTIAWNIFKLIRSIIVR